MKKFFRVLGIALVVLSSALFLVGCDDDSDDEKSSGVVYGVIFETGVEGMEVPTLAVEPNKLALKPDLPLRAGYSLVGWMYEDRMWNFDVDLVTKNIVLTAVWEIDEESWQYTDGLSFVKVSGGYAVSGYLGQESEVKIPLFFDGSEGPDAVVQISDSAFKDNNVIKKVVLTDNIEIIGKNAFEGSIINEIKITKNVTIIDNEAFKDCLNLRKLEFQAEGESIILGERVFENLGIMSFVVPDRVQEIGKEAFKGVNLNSLSFGNSSRLQKIGERAFADKYIQTLKLPSSVLILGKEAFKNNTKLQWAILPSSLQVAGENVFDDCLILSGIYYSGATLPNKSSFHENWLGVSVYEYRYLGFQPTEKGFWKYSSSGEPELYANNILVEIDLNSVSMLDNLDLNMYYAGVRVFYYIREGVLAYKLVEAGPIGQDGKIFVELDHFNHVLFSVEIYNEGVTRYESRADIWLEFTSLEVGQEKYVLG